MRIRTILLTGIAATVATIGLASSAMAATTDANGVVTVTKGDIQSAMGWNNAGWDNYLSTHTVEQMGRLITTGVGNTPTAPDGGMWYLNGQTGTVTAQWLTDPDDWTPQYGWTPVKQTITPESSSAKVEPILNAQKKLTGFKVSSTGTESWTVHTTYPWTEVEGNTFTTNVTIQWPDTDGINGVIVNGKNVPVTPYVAPAV